MSTEKAGSGRGHRVMFVLGITFFVLGMTVMTPLLGIGIVFFIIGMGAMVKDRARSKQP